MYSSTCDNVDALGNGELCLGSCGCCGCCGSQILTYAYASSHVVVTGYITYAQSQFTVTYAIYTVTNYICFIHYICSVHELHMLSPNSLYRLNLYCTHIVITLLLMIAKWYHIVHRDLFVSVIIGHLFVCVCIYITVQCQFNTC